MIGTAEKQQFEVTYISYVITVLYNCHIVPIEFPNETHEIDRCIVF